MAFRDLNTFGESYANEEGIMFQRIKNFFNEVKVETKKVNYPSKEELIGSTWVVVITVFIVSFFLGIVDISLAKVVSFLVR